MALRTIREQGDEILRKKSREVNVEDILLEKNQNLIDDMLETMYHFNGVGLAAVQVGILKQIIVIDVEDDKGPYVLINPKILKTKGSIYKTKSQRPISTGSMPRSRPPKRNSIYRLGYSGNTRICNSRGINF